MKCLIPGRFVKLFGRAIHCLSRIGDELYIEASEEGLALRTVNSSRSAFGCFLFNESFFHEYNSHGYGQDSNGSEEETQRFKLSMKSCLGVFKSLNTLEKNVDTCKLEYDHKETRIVFKLFCRHGIIKTHNLTFQESESLQAVFSKDLCPNLMTAQAKVLIDTAANFPNSCEEVTLSCTPDSIMFKNYLEDEPDPSTIVHTEMKLHPEEFDNYRIGVDTDITFCLKESRAVLAFADFVAQPVSIHFSTCGKPVVFSLDGDSLYEADFVLATLMEQPLSSQASQQAPMHGENAAQGIRVSNNNRLANRKKKKEKLPPTHAMSAANGLEEQNKTDISNVCVDITMEDDVGCLAGATTPTCLTTNADNGEARDKKRFIAADDDDFFSDSFPYKEMLADNTSGKYRTGNGNENTNQALTEIRDSDLPHNSQRISQGKNVSSTCVALPRLGDSASSYIAQEKIGNMVCKSPDDVISSTPPSKKFKSIFFGTVTAPEEIRKRRKLHETVLAADTDDES